MTARISAIAFLFFIVLGVKPLFASEIDNCCFVNRQCLADQEWVDGYFAYQRNECPSSQPAASASTPISVPAGQPIDNCCFVNRQCATNQEWVAGYHAFQRNACPSGQAAGPVASPISSPAGQPINNCCFVNRQCAADEEWVAGYNAFQYDNTCQSTPPATVSSGPVSTGRFACQAPSHSHAIGIYGSTEFKNKLGCALDLLKRRGGRWYNYVVSALKSIQPKGGTLITVYTRSREVKWGIDGGSYRSSDYVSLAAIMVHEACHVHYRGSGSQTSEELECTRQELQALDALGSSPWRRRTLVNRINNLRDDPDLRWWGRD